MDQIVIQFSDKLIVSKLKTSQNLIGQIIKIYNVWTETLHNLHFYATLKSKQSLVLTQNSQKFELLILITRFPFQKY